MPIVTPTLNFDGHCEEVIRLYARTFGGRIDCLLRYSDALKADYDRPLTEAQENFIYHAELVIGDDRIMMCDNMDVPFISSPSQSLTITFDTKEEVLAAYEAMRAGGTIIYPVHSTSYTSCAVVLIDRFGFRWGLMTEQTER